MPLAAPRDPALGPRVGLLVAALIVLWPAFELAEFNPAKLADGGNLAVMRGFLGGFFPPVLGEEFLGLVLNHKDFEWIRSLSALIARLDEWAEEPHTEGDAELTGITQALRALIQPNGPGAAFNAPYWEMVEKEPAVTVAHVKVWRLVDSV